MFKSIVKIVCTFSLFGLMVVGKTQAKDFEDCRETDPNEFFSLINAPVQSYIPPLDRNGNTICQKMTFLFRSHVIILLN